MNFEISIDTAQKMHKMNLDMFRNNRGDSVGFPDIFKALSDPVRRDILILLKENGRMSAGDIVSKFDLTNATVSYHLSQLKKADLVYETKVKHFIYYEINISVFDELMLWISQFKGENNNEKKD